VADVMTETTLAKLYDVSVRLIWDAEGATIRFLD